MRPVPVSRKRGERVSFWDRMVVILSWERLTGIAEVLLYIVLLVVGAGIVLRIAGAALDRIFRPDDEALDARRAKTLRDLAHSVLRYTVNFFVLMAALDHLGVDTRSLLAGAGILGLAVGF